jgi:hypothetical protein
VAKVQLEGLGKLIKSNDLIATQTRSLWDCSIVTQPTKLPCAPYLNMHMSNFSFILINSLLLLFDYLPFEHTSVYILRCVANPESSLLLTFSLHLMFSDCPDCPIQNNINTISTVTTRHQKAGTDATPKV